MPLNLPNNPTIGQTVTEGSRAWFWNGRYWQATSLNVGYTGSKGDTGFTGSKGEQGNFGGVTLDYTYSDDTDSTLYPGAGRLKFNTRDMTQAESLIIADSDDNSINLDNYLATIDASTSEIRGHFKVTKKAYPEYFVMFAITGEIDQFDDYYVIPCNFVSGNLTDSSTAFEAEDDILITFARTGDKGETGFTGSVGFTGSQGPIGSSIDIKGSVETPQDLPQDGTLDGSTLAQPADGLIVNSTGDLYIWDGEQWNNAGRIVGPTGFTGSIGGLGYTGSQGDIGYSGSEGESSFSWGPTPPLNPEVGARWYDTNESILLVYVDDGDSQQWVEVAASGYMGQTGYTGSGAYPSLTNNEGSVLVNDGNTVSWSDGTMMFRNRIINGDMRIDQRGGNTGAAVTAHAGYAVDRWASALTNGTASGISVQRSTDTPLGEEFRYSVRYQVTTGGSSGATGSYGLQQRIEGYNIEDLYFGTAQAQTFTLSFWTKSSVAGTYSVSFRNSAKDRSYIAAYSISTADAWEKKTITITADTVGTWLENNGIGLDIFFDLGSGTGSRSTGGSWLAGNFLGLTGSVSFVENSAASFYLTGAQLERGTVATRFEKKPFHVELASCERYYQRTTLHAFNSAVQTFSAPYFLSTPMRVTPTHAFISSSDNAVSSKLLENNSNKSGRFTIIGTSNASYSVNCLTAFDAEL